MQIKIKNEKKILYIYNLYKHFNCVPLEVKFSHYGLLCKVTFDYKIISNIICNKLMR